ncbi:substrate-binding domain-containing protein [Gloeobacter kilaueensis]|uniref:Phosphate ABC transporter, periplasmic phosphate-binding protein n=1 Tax=Gloeobacter kilaueensis (strain ATCC BAA-2537 / CCAP 1431/1 / ULC 316 / JS1) TaxID=1183438 RepID=U5QJJ9_GLOK1|nr:substrate-binding domain-containing protein [Gloeobacter kilaueensis]AGY59101.1 phosphate ABC transporter, periplasmic phosphate-binding protein [Gloeobacter kilaueensis JS1]
MTSTYGTPTSPPPFTDNQTTSYPYPFNDFNSSSVVLSSTDKSNYSANAKKKGAGDPIQVPTSVSTINLAYNRGPAGQAQLPSILSLSRKQYCDIWAGLITNWNQIVSNVNQTITLVVRSDTNGTTQDFFFHLDTICPSADSRLSPDLFVPDITNGSGSWPMIPNFGGFTATASSANGTASAISAIPYSIGYIPASFVSPYAGSGTPGRNLPSARLQNKSGGYAVPTSLYAFNAVKNFVLTDINGNLVVDDPDDYGYLKTYLVDPSGSTAYPIVSTTFLDLYCTVPRSASIGNAIKSFVQTALAASTFPTTPSQYEGLATSLGFGPLGSSLKTSVRNTVNNINTTSGPCIF